MNNPLDASHKKLAAVSILAALLVVSIASQALGLFNALLAAAGALVALGAVNQMDRETEQTIIFAFATTAAGLIGFALGHFLPDRWQTACFTLLVGGIAALLVGTRRRTVWLPPAWMPRISGGLSAATWLGFLAGVS